MNDDYGMGAYDGYGWGRQTGNCRAWRREARDTLRYMGSEWFYREACDGSIKGEAP